MFSVATHTCTTLLGGGKFTATLDGHETSTRPTRPCSYKLPCKHGEWRTATVIVSNGHAEEKTAATHACLYTDRGN